MNQLLKILTIILVSTAIAELSFSILRWLKTYLSNTPESRLVELALLSIHRDIEINYEMIMDKFSNISKNSNLNFIL